MNYFSLDNSTFVLLVPKQIIFINLNHHDLFQVLKNSDLLRVVREHTFWKLKTEIRVKLQITLKK